MDTLVKTITLIIKIFFVLFGIGIAVVGGLFTIICGGSSGKDGFFAALIGLIPISIGIGIIYLALAPSRGIDYQEENTNDTRNLPGD